MAIQSRKDARKATKGKAVQMPVKSILKKKPVVEIVEQESDEDGEDDDFEDVDEDEESGSDDGEDEDGDDEDGKDEESVDDDESEDEDVDEEMKAAPPKLFVARPDSEDLAVDDIGSDASLDEDAVPRRKLTINNGTSLKLQPALRTLTERIRVTHLPWPETLVLSSKEVLDVDPSDDLQRETAFYKLALEQIAPARKLAAKHDIPFSRPNDYYAEMVKSDEHMERVRTKLVDEAQGIKKSEEAKRQRDLKKYGKQVQVEKLKQREMDRKGFQDKMQGIKRKRKDGMDLGDDGDEFGIEIDDAVADRPSYGGAGGRGRGGKSKMPRHARESKFSVGSGGGRRSKQNTRDSANEFSGFGGFGGKGDRGPPSRGGRGGRGGGRGGRGGRGGGASRGGSRPGKSRRAKGRN